MFCKHSLFSLAQKLTDFYLPKLNTGMFRNRVSREIQCAFFMHQQASDVYSLTAQTEFLESKALVVSRDGYGKLQLQTP